MNAVDENALRRFDELPGSANVRLPVVAALFSISRATVWRWCREGHLPQPNRIQGVTFWNVGELRAQLLSRAKDEPSATQKRDTATQTRDLPEFPGERSE
jgi:predicted DNA-binding transcriptional regulator AlpA